jgi:hypothetical protein
MLTALEKNTFMDEPMFTSSKNTLINKNIFIKIIVQILGSIKCSWVPENVHGSRKKFVHVLKKLSKMLTAPKVYILVNILTDLVNIMFDTLGLPEAW